MTMTIGHGNGNDDDIVGMMTTEAMTISKALTNAIITTMTVIISITMKTTMT
jgi:hypothetical protein